MARTRTEIQEERPIRCCGADVVQVTDGLVGETLCQMMPVELRCRNDAVVLYELRHPLAGLALQESEEPLEPTTQRPRVERATRVRLFNRTEMPFADREGVV